MKRIVTIVLSTVVLSVQAFAANPVIYGADNRKDLYEVLVPQYAQLADSTVALMQTASLNQTASGVINVRARSLAQSKGVCATERFADQPVGAFCSGSLIGKNLILTAGHCITDQTSCNNTKFVFGYNVKGKGQYPSAVSQNDVVGCKRIIKREQVGPTQQNPNAPLGPDFAIIETDRDVNNHAPLRLNLQRATVNIDNGTQLLLIGHPSGLPTKIEDGGRVRDNSKNGFFIANTDSYGGNSGSGVFNLRTGEIEGVLVRGEQDYVNVNGCYVSKVCAEGACRGEDITKIAAILPYLKQR